MHSNIINLIDKPGPNPGKKPMYTETFSYNGQIQTFGERQLFPINRQIQHLNDQVCIGSSFAWQKQARLILKTALVIPFSARKPRLLRVLINLAECCLPQIGIDYRTMLFQLEKLTIPKVLHKFICTVAQSVILHLCNFGKCNFI